MFYHFKKIEVSISSDSKDTMNRTIKVLLKTLYKSIPRRVKLTGVSQGVIEPNVSSNLPGVAYPSESVSPGFATPGSHS